MSVLLGKDGGSLRCLELATGRLVWEKLLSASPHGYREICRADVAQEGQPGQKFWTPPVLCGGRIHCRNYRGELVCVEVSR